MGLSQSDGCAMSKKASLVEWNYTTASCFFIYFTHIASQETLLMTILGLQSFGRLCAERRFNSTHGWAPAFEKSRSDFHENIWESAEVTYFTTRELRKRPRSAKSCLHGEILQFDQSMNGHLK